MATNKEEKKIIASFPVEVAELHIGQAVGTYIGFEYKFGKKAGNGGQYHRLTPYTNEMTPKQAKEYLQQGAGMMGDWMDKNSDELEALARAIIRNG